MPKSVEDALKRSAKRKKLGKKASDAYVYGTMRKMGWLPKPKKKKKK